MIKTIKNRWTSKTPDVWKRVQRVAAVIAAFGAICATSGLALPPTIGWIIAGAGAITMGGAQLTVDSSIDNDAKKK